MKIPFNLSMSVLCLLIFGCSSGPAEEAEAGDGSAPLVELVTSHGRIVLELFPEKAPLTVENFLAYVDAGFYNGLVFHRVMDGFMIQGGGMDENLIPKATRPSIKNEAANQLKNDKGTVAMARTPDPHSASSQFFINLIDNGFLNYRSSTSSGFGYCVFGKVVEGMDTVSKIAKVKTGTKGSHQNVPLEAVVIESASRVKSPVPSGE